MKNACLSLQGSTYHLDYIHLHTDGISTSIIENSHWKYFTNMLK